MDRLDLGMVRVPSSLGPFVVVVHKVLGSRGTGVEVPARYSMYYRSANNSPAAPHIEHVAT